MFDGEMLGKQLTVIVRDFVTRSLAPLLERMGLMEAAIAAVPAGKDGTPGRDGDPGRDGSEGEKGAPGERGETGERGIAGKDGVAGKDGKDGLPGERGAPGEPGKSVTVEELAEAMTGHFAKWALEFERRAADVLQRAVDRIPKPKDGVDGLGVDDLDITHDGDGNVTFAFKRGDFSKTFTIRLPRFKDCGVYRDGVDHREGDGVTWGGSLWLATKDGQLTKPGTPDSGWRLAVKAGRDGKSADAEPAPRVPVKLR